MIDYGRYFIQGGSGIRDNFADVGLLNDPTRKKNQPKVNKDDTFIPKKSISRIKAERKGFKEKEFQIDDASFQTKPVFAKDDFAFKQHITKKATDQSLLESMLPGAFRDQDFVFQSRGECETGKRVYREALFLALKWDQYKKKGNISSESWDLNKLSDEDPLFTTYPALSSNDLEDVPVIEKGKTALEKLLLTKIPDQVENIASKANVSEFTKKKINDVTVKTFFTGPEDKHSDWEDNLIARIESSNERIVIDQMYFQPTRRVMDALIKAGNRNVDITVITASDGKHSSISEKFFGPRNRYNLHYLFSSVLEENKKNIHMYTYSQPTNGLHKKVVIVDDCVLAGSSNMGTKSLILTGDHEMNFEAQSRDLADKTMEILEEDKKASKHLKDINLTVGDRVIASVHSLGAFIWG